MKKMLKYFLDNLKKTVSLTSIVLGCLFLIFLFFASLDFVVSMFASPVVAFMVCILFVIIMSSVFLTLLDMSSNKGD